MFCLQLQRGPPRDSLPAAALSGRPWAFCCCGQGCPGKDSFWGTPAGRTQNTKRLRHSQQIADRGAATENRKRMIVKNQFCITPETVQGMLV